MMSDSIDPQIKDLQLKVSILEDVIKQLVFKNGDGKLHYTWQQNTNLYEKAPYLKHIFKED